MLDPEYMAEIQKVVAFLSFNPHHLQKCFITLNPMLSYKRKWTKLKAKTTCLIKSKTQPLLKLKRTLTHIQLD